MDFRVLRLVMDCATGLGLCGADADLSKATDCSGSSATRPVRLGNLKAFGNRPRSSRPVHPRKPWVGPGPCFLPGARRRLPDWEDLRRLGPCCLLNSGGDPTGTAHPGMDYPTGERRRLRPMRHRKDVLPRSSRTASRRGRHALGLVQARIPALIRPHRTDDSVTEGPYRVVDAAYGITLRRDLLIPAPDRLRQAHAHGPGHGNGGQAPARRPCLPDKRRLHPNYPSPCAERRHATDQQTPRWPPRRNLQWTDLLAITRQFTVD